MSRANFYKWVQAFKDGRESITDDLRSGRPVDVSTPEAVQAVEDLIKSDRRVTLDEIATKLDISHGTVYAIVREKLHFFFFFICHIYPPFTRKRCIAMFWTGSPHSLGSCHFRVTCLPHKGGASR